MRRKVLAFVSLVIAVAVAAGVAWAMASSEQQTTAAAAAAASLVQTGDSELSLTPAGKPPKPPAEACCDPALEPGANGNPLCFEGHTCCFDGVWRCNNPDGTPSCKAGTVCDAGCASVGDPCASNADCCSNKCKGKRCR